MELATRYQPQEIEQRWYQSWLERDLFRSVPDDRPPYTVVIPPPNVTGILHMGHMLNNTIQDVLVRKARMEGKNACWVPGTDHASIATEAKVVAMLREKGMTKSGIGREAFLGHAWDWKEKYGGIILEQQKKLGASVDWSRTRFTMEPDLSEAVLDTFIHLHRRGLIYRGSRMVNWDPQGRTAVSDEEVIYKEVNSRLYHVRYPIAGTDSYITIATTRPETILADTAICVHPEDPRYKSLVGLKAIVPFTDRAVPVISDEYVDPEFGTGCLKVTPAHDPNDYELGLRHGLEIIDILQEDGTISEAAGRYVGMDRFACRRQIVQDLEEAGYLVKVEDIRNKVGYSERTDAVIEPRLSLQWFCRMRELAGPALDVVLNGEVRIHPEKFVNTYRHWMENVKDWCISRQLWWGQRIPAWYNDQGDVVVCKTAQEAGAQFREQGLPDTGLRQEEDVVDTWFSSWLWPITVFDGLKDPANEEINYYYPTNVLVTAPEILFFWVARMIMAGLEFRGEVPFRDVYLHGIVRDKQGRKMSKSLGNSPDPLELIDQYGADAVRMGMLLSAPAGNDILFDITQVEQGRNFCNKIWNAFRLIRGWEVADMPQPDESRLAGEWFRSRLSVVTAELHQQFDQFRLSDALMTLYKLIWNDYCAWYLEMIKPPFGQPVDRTTLTESMALLDTLLELLHPFMPFITEELWQHLGDREAQSICLAAYPRPGEVDQDRIADMELGLELIGQVRNIRNQKQISPKEILHIAIRTQRPDLYAHLHPILVKLGNLGEITVNPDAVVNGVTFMVRSDEVTVLLEEQVDATAEREKLTAELEYTEGFLRSVEAKLGNERFVQNAKAEIVASERKKQADALARIQAIRDSLARL